jgi:hypothetical protein
VHPNAVEHCNNRDDDCDEVVDEDPIDALEWAPDGDGDGFGDAGQAVISCSEVAGSVGNADDCDDADSDIFPWADEVCDDGIDQDCSGVADNTCPVGWDVVTDASVWLESTSQRGARRVVVHDLDGDGTDDLVGGWHKDGGAVAVLSGPVTGSQAYTPAAVGAAGSDFGHELAIVGDALAVGAPLKDDVGAVYLFADGDLTEAFATVVGTVEDGALGRYGLVGGDLDGDGEGDLAASSSKSQATFVFMGPLSGALDQSNAHAQVKATGFEQLATGDLNGDGIDDLVSPYRTLSEVYGWYGPVTGELPTSDADIYLSGEASDYFGGAVAIGDHDGDGHGDLAVSGYYDSTGATQAGGVWVFDGPDQTESLHLFHTGSYAYLGSYNSGAVELHDLNDDGRDDLLVGAASDDLDETNSGSVFVVHGALGGGSLATDDADLIVTGGFYSYCGFGIAVGDLTGDGVPDLAVACRGYDGNASGVVSVNGFVSVLAGPLF